MSEVVADEVVRRLEYETRCEVSERASDVTLDDR
jgi:hypothetical protein